MRKARKARRERRAPTPPNAITRFLAHDPTWVYWLVLVAAFAWTIWANFDLLEGQETLRWRSTTGTIIKADVSSHTSSSSSSGNPGRAGGHRSSTSTTSWHVDVTYEYMVDHRSYTGDRIGWNMIWSYDSVGKARAKARELAQHPAITVYYDPVRPSHAVLERGIDATKLIGGVLAIAAACGLLIFKHLQSRQPAPTDDDASPTKRERPHIKRGILGGLAAAVVFGFVQYLIYTTLFV